MAALPHSYVDRASSDLDQTLDYYLITTEAADERLRGLPPVPVTHEFTDRKGALDWLDAERASLVAAVQAAATPAGTTPRRACRCCWPITWASGACSTTCCSSVGSDWTLPGGCQTGPPNAAP